MSLLWPRYNCSNVQGKTTSRYQVTLWPRSPHQLGPAGLAREHPLTPAHGFLNPVSAPWGKPEGSFWPDHIRVLLLFREHWGVCLNKGRFVPPATAHYLPMSKAMATLLVHCPDHRQPFSLPWSLGSCLEHCCCVLLAPAPKAAPGLCADIPGCAIFLMDVLWMM